MLSVHLHEQVYAGLMAKLQLDHLLNLKCWFRQIADLPVCA